MCPVCGLFGSLRKNRYGEWYCSECGFHFNQQMYFDFRGGEKDEMPMRE